MVLTKSNVIVPTIENINISNGHISPSSQHSVLSTLKYSLIKHQRKSNIENSSNDKSKTKTFNK